MVIELLRGPPDAVGREYNGCQTVVPGHVRCETP
jgi:hypothetical protein